MNHSDTRHPFDPAAAAIPSSHAWAKLPIVCLIVAGLGFAGAIAFSNDDARFYFAYLVAYLFWLSLALGGLFFTILQHVTKAGWSIVVRRLAELSMATLPALAVLFIPILLGMHDLYHWTHFETGHLGAGHVETGHLGAGHVGAHTEAVVPDPILAGKVAYLNVPFFLLRAAIYFIVWIGLAWFYLLQSTRQDKTGDAEASRRMQRFSGPAVALFALSCTFASFDWIMSLEPHWYSTIFGVYFFSGALVGFFSWIILIALLLRRAGFLRGALTDEHLHDLGKFLFGFVIFWAYIGFSQYLLIWYANLPEETIWFRTRLHGSWRDVSIFLALGHFMVPFFYLLPRTIKRTGLAVAIGALWMLAMHLLDLHWLVLPSHTREAFSPAVVDLFTWIGVGGLFGCVFAMLLRRYPLIPLKDPRLHESLAFENF